MNFTTTWKLTQCTNIETGWIPEHIVIKNNGELIGVFQILES